MPDGPFPLLAPRARPMRIASVGQNLSEVGQPAGLAAAPSARPRPALRSSVLGLTLALLASLLVSPAALAQTAPEPRRAIDIERFMGRWYEIIRTPNNRQRNCHGAYQVWSRTREGAFDIDQVCHVNGRDGPARHVDTAARIVDPATNAKFEASFFGGLIRRQYWVIDRADDYGWMIASTADGKFASLLARTPGLPAAKQAALKARMRALGFDHPLEEVGATTP